MKNTSKNKAVFLDRDGVINRDGDHVYKIKDFKFFKDTFEALLKIPKEYKKIIITNQAGIAKGLYTLKDFQTLNKWMLAQFKKNHITIDKVYFCPHHEKGTIKKYAKKCTCRKPRPGMILKAIKTYKIDAKKSWFIGDKESDMIAGRKSKCNTILIDRSGSIKIRKLFVSKSVKTLSDAVKIIIKFDE